MGRWSELMIESRSPRYCFSSEEYKEATRDSYSRLVLFKFTLL